MIMVIVRYVGGMTMVRKLVTVIVIGAGLGLAACNTVRGAAADINSAANCTENTMNGGRC
jgi:predicted small secreted protein